MSVDVLVIGTGEYVTGLTSTAHAAGSDKPVGVVARVLFDLRARGLVGRIGLCARDPQRLPAIARHFERNLGGRSDEVDLAFDGYAAPGDPVADALGHFAPGDVAILATPDATHAAIAAAAVERGLHVLVAKPLVQTLADHVSLEAAAARKGVLVAGEYHKRWDPMYADARERIRDLGDLSLFSSYMSQPKSQLETFRAWAGRGSDISYYLNSHHVDFCAWALAGRARPRRVAATAARGFASAVLGRLCEDTIALTVTWENIESGEPGVSFHAASWIAPAAEVHSQQRFHCLGTRGEVRVDQAHRGYSTATDAAGFANPNPLFMAAAPAGAGLVRRTAYGYRSIEAFIEAARAVQVDGAAPSDFDDVLATAAATRQTTAILEAGRRSLDRDGQTVVIDYSSAAPLRPERLGT